MIIQVSVIKKAWNHAGRNVKEDAMRSLNCCAFDRSEFDSWSNNPKYVSTIS